MTAERDVTALVIGRPQCCTCLWNIQAPPLHLVRHRRSEWGPGYLGHLELTADRVIADGICEALIRERKEDL